MLLHQRGLLHLDAPVGDLLPGFVVGRPSAERAHHVRLSHLLAHSSGLPGYVELFRTAHTPAALFRACLRLPLEADPGTCAEYSDTGFIVLGKALEMIAREHLASWTRREIFAPLGMSATGYCPAPEKRPFILPTEEDSIFRKRRMQGEVQDENACVLRGAAGHAGLFSSVPDLLRFARAILPTAAKPGNAAAQPTLFAPETIELFARRQPPSGSSRVTAHSPATPQTSPCSP